MKELLELLEDRYEMDRGYRRLSDLLYETALKLCDEYHSARNDYLKNKEAEGISYLICRVQRNQRGLGISIGWYRQKFIPSEKKRVLSEYIKKGKKYNYDLNKIIDWRTLPWEREMVLRLEPQFTALRKISESLAKFYRSYNTYLKRLDYDCFDPENEWYKK